MLILEFAEAQLLYFCHCSLARHNSSGCHFKALAPQVANSKIQRQSSAQLRIQSNEKSANTKAEEALEVMRKTSFE